MIKRIVYISSGIILFIAAVIALTAFLEKPRPVLKIGINNDVKHFSALNAAKADQELFQGSG